MKNKVMKEWDTEGGILGYLSYAYIFDIENPKSTTESVSVGAGINASAMSLASKTFQYCLNN